VTGDLLKSKWEEAQQHAFLIARGERLALLRGRRVRSFDDRGLHPFSMEVARILLLQELQPELHEHGFDHHNLRRNAEEEAMRMFAEEYLAQSKTDGSVDEPRSSG
jgi:hypothetical protein